MENIGLFEGMQTQLSARGYTDQPVTDEQIARILEAATWAPNATNRQLWEFIVVRDAEMKKQLAGLYRKSYMLLADSLPANEKDVTQAESADAPTLSKEGETAYVADGDPRTQPKTMLKWSVNLAETMEEVPVLIVVGYDRAGMPYAWGWHLQGVLAGDRVHGRDAGDTESDACSPRCGSRDVSHHRCQSVRGEDERSAGSSRVRSARRALAARVPDATVHTTQTHPVAGESPLGQVVAMLENGSVLPDIAARDTEGNGVALADVTAGSWSVVLFYRGHW